MRTTNSGALPLIWASLIWNRAKAGPQFLTMIRLRLEQLTPPVGFRDDTSDVDMDDDDSMTAQDRDPADSASQSRQGQPSTGLIAPVPPKTATDSDLVQRFLNNPDLLRQLQLAQMNPSTPEEPLDPEAAQEL